LERIKEIDKESKLAATQEKMGPAPVMGSSYQTPTPPPVNIRAGAALAGEMPTGAELAAATAAMLASGGVPKPGMPPPALAQQFIRGMFPAAGAAAGTRGIIEAGRPLVTGEESRYSQMAPAAIYGASMAFPTAGSLAPSLELASARGVLPTLGKLGAESTYQAGVGAMASAAEEAAAGRPVTLTGMMLPAGIGAGMGGTIGIATLYGEQFLDRAAKAFRNATAYIDAGIDKVTPAMLEPGRYGAEEARRIREGLLDKNGNPTTKRVEAIFAGINNGLTAIVGDKPEGALVASAVRKRVMAIPEAEERLAKAVQVEDASKSQLDAARARVLQTEEAHRKFLSEETSRAHKSALVAEQQAREANHQATFARIADEARLEAVQGLTGGVKPLSSSDAAISFVEKIVKPVDAAYQKYFNEGYGVLPSIAGFDPTAIIKEAEALRKNLAGTAPVTKPEVSALNDIIDALQGAGRPQETTLLGARGEKLTIGPEFNGLTLAQMRNIRDKAYDVGKVGEITTANRTKIKELGHLISEQIDAQAEKVYGKEMGSHLRGLNYDYRQYKELESAKGISTLFATDVRDDRVEAMVNGLIKNGPSAEDYSGIVRFIENLALPAQGKRIERTAAGPVFLDGASVVAPEVAAAYKGHLNGLIQGNIIQRSLGNFGIVDNVKLAGFLEKLSNHKDMPEMLGFKPAEMKQLIATLKDFPDAGRMTQDEMAGYLINPGFRAKLEQAGQGMATPIRMDLASRAVQERMNQAAVLGSINRLNEARAAYSEAEAVAKKNGITAEDARKAYMTALNDPGLKVFGQGGKGAEGAITPDSYKSILSSLFDPAAGKTTNQYVSNVFTYLKNSKDMDDQKLLQQLRAGYVRDYLDLFQKEGRSGMLGELPSAGKMATYAKPMPGSAAASEMERARIVLAPDQMEALQKTAFNLGEQLRAWEKSLPEPSGRPGEEKIGKTRTFVGEVYRGFEGAAAALRRRDYDNALAAIITPKDYVNKLYINGQWLTLGGRAAEAAPGRIYMENRQESQAPNVQVPQMLRNFLPQSP